MQVLFSSVLSVAHWYQLSRLLSGAVEAARRKRKRKEDTATRRTRGHCYSQWAFGERSEHIVSYQIDAALPELQSLERCIASTTADSVYTLTLLGKWTSSDFGGVFWILDAG